MYYTAKVNNSRSAIFSMENLLIFSLFLCLYIVSNQENGLGDKVVFFTSEKY